MNKRRDPFNQNFRKFRSRTEWIGSVQKVHLSRTAPFYIAKEDISTGTGLGQTVKDVVDLEVGHLSIKKKITKTQRSKGP